jgi:hypothetical protein
MEVSGWYCASVVVVLPGGCCHRYCHCPAAVQAQCQNMTNKWHVYMTMDGRISMAGLSGRRARYLADAIKDSVINC